jgi:hypothetical protein
MERVFIASACQADIGPKKKLTLVLAIALWLVLYNRRWQSLPA